MYPIYELFNTAGHRRLTMFIPIRIRAGSAGCYPYNTPRLLVNNAT